MEEENDKEKDVEKGHTTRKSIVMPSLPKLLSVEEKKYLLAVERGDMANVKRILQVAQRKKTPDINCVDSLGRGALTISIDQENLEMVELLIIMGVETKDALLHAINVEFVEAVELLLEHEELIHKEGEPYSWQKVDHNTASFTPDITPLVLAAHRNNYEILKILLDRGATLPMPHDIKCGCEECIKMSQQDSLRQALSRLNEYRALASPSLIALSSSDPILTAFQLSWELRGLAFAEPECKSEYMDLRRQCQQFAVDLLHQSRSSHELAIILNHNPEDPIPYEEGEHMQLARLELAIQYKQKKFVAHPNIQQLLAAIWYEGVPGFRRKTSSQKVAIIVKVALLFPFYCMLYIVAPNTRTGKLMRKPFMKFLIHASSYLFFLLILILVSQRAEDLFLEYFGTEDLKKGVFEKYEKQRGNPPMLLEYVVLVYVIGFIVEETHEMYSEGLSDYLRNMWNIIDCTRNILYTAVILLRLAAYIEQNSEISRNPGTAYLRREAWDPFDFQLVAEGLFAAANIFSAVKLVHLFSINPHLGPLQISLGRMVIDIVKFFFIYSLVLFAFACGLNQLLWYFSDLERQKCFHLPNGNPDFDNFSDACMKWRRFANVFESSQSLFWASFGLMDLSSFELTGIKAYTRFWGLLMFGSYSVINVIVLLNLLIAMMSNSYAIIEEHSDTEWKFARTKLWMSYFEESATLPPPFNIIPTPKMFLKFFGIRHKDKLRRLSTRRRNREEKERDYKYSAVMRALVWRYVATMHKREEENPVTEDDVNELKGDISSFRYEIMEVLHRNGMNVSSAERKEKAAILGKKNKVWERRLMKDFKVGPIATEEDDDMLYALPPENESPTSKFRRVAKMAVLNSGMNKWRQVIKGACIASQIGHCHNRDSFKKQQNLQRAIMEAKNLSSKSPDVRRSITPVNLPDTTGSNIINIIRDIDGTPSNIATPKAMEGKIFLTPSREEPDLINLESQKASPLPAKTPSSPSFKYILSDEFSPKSLPRSFSRTASPGNNPVRHLPSSNERKNDEEYLRIHLSDDPKSGDKIENFSRSCEGIKESLGEEKDTDNTEDVMENLSLIRKLQEESLSPELKITGTEGENIAIRSPVPSRKFQYSVPPTPKKCVPVKSSDVHSPVDSDALSSEKEPSESILTVTSIAPGQSKSNPTSFKKSPVKTPSPTPNSTGEIENDTSQKRTNSPTSSEHESSSTSDENSQKNVERSEEIASISKPEKTKGPTVSFSPTLDDKEPESSSLFKPISPKKISVPPKSPLKSTLKVDDQKPSTSATASLSPCPNSPSSSNAGPSPLASRNIHRVPKKYQPKYGWL